MSAPGVLLLNPKYPHNVGAVLRACALLGVPDLFWTGRRVFDPSGWTGEARLPREERMRCYRRTTINAIGETAQPISMLLREQPYIPVAVEIGLGGQSLLDFEHPENALYVFGAEDETIDPGIRRQCHAFVEIPNAIPEADVDARTPYNLSHAVALVLFARYAAAGTYGGLAWARHAELAR